MWPIEPFGTFLKQKTNKNRLPDEKTPLEH